jgi:hypothetical protein
VYVAYDDANVYVAAAVNEPSYACAAGQSASDGGGFPRGMPGGIFTIQRQGDCFCFAFGFRPRVPEVGRQLDEPWAWKGHYFDTDYLYVAHSSTNGDQLVQNWDAATKYRRWGYQTDNLPEHHSVTGGQVKIVRSGTTTTYETAIPRTQMPLFNPANMDACRFAFIIVNAEAASTTLYDTKEDMKQQMQYTRNYGVFDHWNKLLSSFGPSWVPLQPCQTRFAIEGGTPTAVNSAVQMNQAAVVVPLAAQRDRVFNRQRN